MKPTACASRAKRSPTTCSAEYCKRSVRVHARVARARLELLLDVGKLADEGVELFFGGKIELRRIDARVKLQPYAA